MPRPIETKKARDAKADQRSRVARFMDNRIASLFPGWGVKRTIARKQLKMFASSSYHAAGTGRLHRSRTGLGGAATEHQTIATLWTLREAARDLVRNNALAAGLLQTCVDNVIASGHVFGR